MGYDDTRAARARSSVAIMHARASIARWHYKELRIRLRAQPDEVVIKVRFEKL